MLQKGDVVKKLVGSMIDELVDVLHDDLVVRARITEKIIGSSKFQDQVKRTILSHIKK